jgi:integrase
VTGGFRAVTALVKRFRGVAKAMKLRFKFSPRGMRRTFNDLAWTANIEAVVTRSLNGHLTERMQERAL